MRKAGGRGELELECDGNVMGMRGRDWCGYLLFRRPVRLAGEPLAPGAAKQEQEE